MYSLPSILDLLVYRNSVTSNASLHPPWAPVSSGPVLCWVCGCHPSLSLPMSDASTILSHWADGLTPTPTHLPVR